MGTGYPSPAAVLRGSGVVRGEPGPQLPDAQTQRCCWVALQRESSEKLEPCPGLGPGDLPREQEPSQGGDDPGVDEVRRVDLSRAGDSLNRPEPAILALQAGVRRRPPVGD